MRTLLVDNYDSYSYNLYQLIARTTGVEPVVLRNDDPALRQVDPDDFDGLVISPGPGHPGRPRDLGPAADLLSGSGLPTLGVCLGHQGIALAAGARVHRAPVPRHGHLSPICHRGEGLFAGIPQNFTGVRYHSLAVPEPLPAVLEATAWAEDGVVMGLRHRTRPQWGVQFHPESISAEFGAELIANYARLALAHRGASASGARRTRRRASGPAGRTNRGDGARQGDGPYRLHVRRLGREPDTEKVFRTLFANSPHAFWLDSSRVEPGLSRFSFLGDASGPLAETVRYRADSGHVEVTAADGTVTKVAGTVFDHLRDQLARRRTEASSLPFDFACGYVGYFGYELRADCGSPLARPSTVDDAGWIFADRLIAVDHEQRTAYLLCLSRRDRADQQRAELWLRETGSRIAALPPHSARVTAPGPVAPTPPDHWLARNREQHVADVRRCHEELRAGESYEICLTNTLTVPAGTDALAAYTRLRRLNPAPYAAYLRFGEMEAACSSPERFLRITTDGVVESKPIKGTAPRGTDAASDARLKEALATDPKTRAENLMIVDLLRNDLGRLCAIGTVHVPRLMHVESYATVHQLVSTVRGTLRPDADAVSCVRACFPGGSMTGAPKLRTMEIIDRLEGTPRGIYSGSIGYLGLGGGADLNIVIRTAVRSGGQWTVGTGGAIVLDSEPAEEYREMLLKAGAPVRALLPEDPLDEPSPTDAVREHPPAQSPAPYRA